MKTLDNFPVAKRERKVLSKFGVTREDDFYWLNQREDPQVLAYLREENAYLERVMQPYQPLREKLYQEMVSRLKPDDASVPYRRGDFYYYSRFEQGKEYPIYCRRKELEAGEEEVMLDGNLLAKDQEYFEIGSLSVSRNQNILAFTTDTVGRRIYQIRFKNLTTGEVLPDVIDHVDPSLAWAGDNATLYYVRTDENTLRSYQVYRHFLGSQSSQDELVFEETDDTFHLDVFATSSRDYLVMQSFSTLSTECRILAADDPKGRFRLVLARESNHRYFLEHFGRAFYILSNENAINYKLLRANPDAMERESWESVLPHRQDVLLEDFHEFRDYLVVLEREKGMQRIRILPANGNQEHVVAFDQEVYTLHLGRNCVYESQVLRFEMESLAVPHSVFDYNMASRERLLLKQETVVGGFEASNYITMRLQVPARDGASVPISLVYHKDFPPGPERSLLLYGYGAYGIKIDPTFRSARLSLIDRGFTYAIAHIRGGSDLGRPWYEDGKMERKMNTFNDFLDCGQYLVDCGYTSKSRMFAIGGSAGGMLMGVVANLRPDLFRGLVAVVPFVDCLTTMLDESIPLTTGEYNEWGNPNDEKYFREILAYSPYDNIQKQEYPAMLVIAGLHDSQVQYWEPAKWVAKLRMMKTNTSALLLHTQMEAGHSGASGRFRRYEEEALQHSFLLALAGEKDAGDP